jgi:hypothetical protein
VIWLLACHRRRLLKEGFLPPILFFSSPLSSTNNNHQHQPLPSRTTIPTLHFIAPLNPSFVRTINNLRQSSASDSHQPPTVINLRQSSTFLYSTYYWAHSRKDWDNLQVRHKISHTVWFPPVLCLSNQTRGVLVTAGTQLAQSFRACKTLMNHLGSKTRLLWLGESSSKAESKLFESDAEWILCLSSF